jgi:ribosomal protein L11 methyltransferase
LESFLKPIKENIGLPMKWIRTTVMYASDDPETASAMISDLFQGYGLKGVIVESPETDFNVDWADDAVPETSHHAVIGFFPENQDGKTHRDAFERQLFELKPSLLSAFEVTYSDVDDEDWAESWKLHFHPVKITGRIVIKPSWQHFETKEGEIIIDLDPGMAFGTGTHPTTALCIQMVEVYLKEKMRFLDIGTGSGILMAVAAKLGAEKPEGIDNDPMAVEVARTNLLRNDICDGEFLLMEGDLVKSVNSSYNMIVANIIAETICALVPDLPPLLYPGGIFITSGIIVEKEAMVVETLQKYGFEILETRQLEGWCAIAAKIIPS